MTIAIGDPIPDVKVFTFGENGPAGHHLGRGAGNGQGRPFCRPGCVHPDMLGSPPAGLRHADR